MCIFASCAYVCLCADTLQGKRSHGHSQAAASREGSLILGDRDGERSIGIAHTYLLKMEIYKCISNPIQ